MTDLVKIGKFIAEKRKEKNLTQMELAEKLYITDRAISKWECGKSMPDSSIMLELCNILEISVNELLTGEEIKMEEYNKKAELNLIEMKKQKEISDKRLLKVAIIMGFFAIIFLSCFNLLLGFIKVEIWLRIFLEVSGIIIYLSLILIIVRVEQVTGYYECGKCHHKYIPTYKQMAFSLYMGKVRYIKCPHCGKKSLNKKVLSK